MKLKWQVPLRRRRARRVPGNDGASENVSSQCVGFVRNARECARMVCRLVRRVLFTMATGRSTRAT